MESGASGAEGSPPHDRPDSLALSRSREARRRRDGQVTELRRDEGPFSRWMLEVSPDEEWILYGQMPAWESELMLVENFRSLPGRGGSVPWLGGTAGMVTRTSVEGPHLAQLATSGAMVAKQRVVL